MGIISPARRSLGNREQLGMPMRSRTRKRCSYSQQGASPSGKRMRPRADAAGAFTCQTRQRDPLLGAKSPQLCCMIYMYSRRCSSLGEQYLAFFGKCLSAPFFTLQGASCRLAYSHKSFSCLQAGTGTS